MTVKYPVTEDHRWKRISHALAVNPDPDGEEGRERKGREQERLRERNERVKKKEGVERERCYYCHGCGDRNDLSKNEPNKNNLPAAGGSTVPSPPSLCTSCGTPNVMRSPEECFVQLPVLYSKFKDKVLSTADEVVMIRRIGSLFESYTAERGKKMSQEARAERKYYDEKHCYGEWNLGEFNRMFQRCRRIFGFMPATQAGVFWDLGCGFGKLTVAAGCVHPFSQCWGIESLRSLAVAGEGMVGEFRDTEEYKKEAARYRDITFRVVNSDFEKSDAWVDNTTVCIWHSTCEDDAAMDNVTEKARSMNVGTLFITVTRPLPDDDLWFRIGEDEVDMEWGRARIFFHEKIAVG